MARCKALLLALSILLFHSLYAQQVFISAPHKPVAPQIAVPHVTHAPIAHRIMVGGFWRVGPDLKATIHLSNDVVTSVIAASPVVYLASGRRVPLPTVNVDAGSVAVIDIRDQLSRLGINIGSEEYGYVEVHYDWAWDALCVSIKNIDTNHSLIFVTTLEPLVKPVFTHSRPLAALMQQNQLEGLWWKEEPNVRAFVSLSNTSSSLVSAKVQVTDDTSRSLGTHTVSLAPHTTSLVDLDELKLTTARQGGLRITHDGLPDYVQISGGLVDEAVGFRRTCRCISLL